MRPDTSDVKQELVLGSQTLLHLAPLMISSKNFINTSKHKPSLRKYNAPALKKGSDILEFLADFPEGLSRVDIAKGLGRSLNEIFRLICVLEKRGCILSNPEIERYSLSLTLFVDSQSAPTPSNAGQKSSSNDDAVVSFDRSILSSWYLP